ncbi:hypothetical protein U1Q18_006791 [Sarracenia purpurea var. burkii]
MVIEEGGGARVVVVMGRFVEEGGGARIGCGVKKHEPIIAFLVKKHELIAAAYAYFYYCCFFGCHESIAQTLDGLLSNKKAGGLFCFKEEDDEALLQQMKSIDPGMRDGSKVVAVALNKEKHSILSRRDLWDMAGKNLTPLVMSWDA